jgi:hypothetical protein
MGLMTASLRAPELSATSRIERIWIMAVSPWRRLPSATAAGSPSSVRLLFAARGLLSPAAIALSPRHWL